LGRELADALGNSARISFDSVDNAFEAPRVTLQFPVSPEVCDWFYSSRTGYRAQFWASPQLGSAFNSRLLAHLKSIIQNWAPSVGVCGRAVLVDIVNGDRMDTDGGPRSESRSTVLASLHLELSKIWICERLLQADGKPPKTILSLDVNGPLLIIPRWSVYRRSLMPQSLEEGTVWLDIKGGYVRPDGTIVQPNKSPEKRAQDINLTGWT
jgi:hypothetical protein